MNTSRRAFALAAVLAGMVALVVAVPAIASEVETRVRALGVAPGSRVEGSTEVSAGQHRGNTAVEIENASASRVAPKTRLGDLRPDEIRQIQSVVDEAGRPLEVVGSAARGSRRGVGTDLSIGKGPGTRSDIDYLVPRSGLSYYETTGLYKNLPDLDRIIPGVHNPFIGPAVRFEPYARPYFVPGAGG